MEKHRARGHVWSVEVSCMACCTRYCAAEAQFKHKVAERDLRRYRRRGPDATTRLMLAELRRWPLEGRRVLDVGGGIGVISRELAGAGVASATTVEASSAYLEVARRDAGSQYGPRPTQFILGDFAVIAGTLPDADVVTLDRGVCCYPEAEALLREAAGRARQLLAFGYPRDRWHVRTMFGLGNFWLRLTRKKSRAFVHPPECMRAVLEAAGLVRATASRNARLDTRPCRSPKLRKAINIVRVTMLQDSPHICHFKRLLDFDEGQLKAGRSKSMRQALRERLEKLRESL